MKFNLIYILQYFFILILSIVRAVEFEGKCKEIYDYLKDKEIIKEIFPEENHYIYTNELDKHYYFLEEIEDYYDAVGDCVLNENNEISKLVIQDVKLSQKDFDKISSLSNLTELDPEGIYSYDRCCTFADLYNEQFNMTISNFQKSIKNLEIDGMALNQSNIEDISTLINLESLTFYECLQMETLNYSSLKNLEKLSSLYFYEMNLNDIPDFVYSLPKIKKLNFQSNYIKTIPSKLSELENLEY
eukprot:jgi/Orpsp1_1/1184685/evm.model.c7180000090570.1